MPIMGDGTFASSRILMYKNYLLRYFRLLDKTGGMRSDQALEMFMREVERDFPNDKVHPGDVIIAACDLAWQYGQMLHRPATEAVLRIISGWKGTGGRAHQRLDDDAIVSGKIVLPPGVAIPQRRKN